MLPSNTAPENIQLYVNSVLEEAMRQERGQSSLQIDNPAEKIYLIMRRYMTYPSLREVEQFKNIMFCDDVSEAYRLPLVSEEQLPILRTYLILPRICRKLLLQREKKMMPELYWPYGVVAYVHGAMHRSWYRLNLYLWEWLHFTLH